MSIKDEQKKHIEELAFKYCEMVDNGDTDIETVLAMLSVQCYRLGYSQGYDDGFDDGFKDGKDEGYSNGYINACEQHKFTAQTAGQTNA